MAPTSTPQTPFGRVLTAMVTPFTADGALDLDGAQRLATHLVDAGNDGLIVNGTTGESPPPATRRKRISYGRSWTRSATAPTSWPVSAPTTPTTAWSWPARGGARRRPRPAGRHAVLQQAPAGGPLPALHGRRRRRRAARDALRHPRPQRRPDQHRDARPPRRAPRIVANKDAKGDLGRAGWAIARSGLAWYSGDDMLNLPLLSIGAVGFVSVVGHVVTPRAARPGRRVHLRRRPEGHRDPPEAAPRLHGHVPHPGRDDHQGGARPQGPPAGPLRAPMVECTPEEIEQLKIDLAAGGVQLQ